MARNKRQKGSIVAQNKDHTLYKLWGGKVVSKEYLVNKMKKGRKYYDLKGAEISFVEQQDGSIFLRTIADQSSSNNLSDVPIAELSGTKTISEHSQQVNGRRRVRFNKYYSQILIPSICLILIALSVFLGLFLGCKKSNSPPPSPIPKIVPEELLTFSGDNTTVTGHEDISAYNTLIIPKKHNEVDITSIGSSAFQDCSSLISITLPNTLTSIGGYAFRDCPSLTSFTLTQVSGVATPTFQLVDGITGDLVTDGSARTNAFLIKSNDVSSGNITATCGATITQGGIAVGNIILSSIDGHPVNSINNFGFRFSSLVSVTFPNTFTSISDSAFGYCTSLTSITLPNSLVYIGSSTFSHCSSLHSIILPNSLTGIASSSFSGCSSLTSIALTRVIDWTGSTFQLVDGTNGSLVTDGSSRTNAFLIKSSDITNGTITATCGTNGGIAVGNITIPSAINGTNITSIDNQAFASCESLKSIDLHSLTSIGSNVFERCSFLTSVTLPNSLTSISNYVFANCFSLTSINLPNVLISIGNYAFQSCSSLTSLTLPNTLTSIGDYAFESCSSLTSITLPNTLTSIGNGAFRYCPSINSLSFTQVSGVVSPTFQLFDCTTNALVADDLSRANAFLIKNSDISSGNITSTCGTNSGGIAIGNIIIPSTINNTNNITSIGGYAFAYCCSITSLTLSDSLTNIGNSAFRNCSSLTSITAAYTSQPTWAGTGIFGGVNANGTVVNNDATYTSDLFCTYLKNSQNLPSGWEP